MDPVSTFRTPVLLYHTILKDAIKKSSMESFALIVTVWFLSIIFILSHSCQLVNIQQFPLTLEVLSESDTAHLSKYVKSWPASPAGSEETYWPPGTVRAWGLRITAVAFRMIALSIILNIFWTYNASNYFKNIFRYKGYLIPLWMGSQTKSEIF